MDDDNIIVGKGPSIQKSAQNLIRRSAALAGATKKRADKPSTSKSRRITVCGEMSQQCGHSGAQSMPQTFLQLVGYRDPNAGSVKK